MSNLDLFNFTDGNPLEFADWTNYLGNFVPLEIIFSIIFISFALVIWLKDTTGYMLTVYLILVGMAGSTAAASMHSSLVYVFGIFLAMGIGMALYRIYESRSQFGG